MDKPKVTCRCGSVIEYIDYWNGCNEEGEDYGIVKADCDKCGRDYEASKWGEWEDENEAINCLNYYILDGYL